jgi:hypothetical protein
MNEPTAGHESVWSFNRIQRFAVALFIVALATDAGGDEPKPKLARDFVYSGTGSVPKTGEPRSVVETTVENIHRTKAIRAIVQITSLRGAKGLKRETNKVIVLKPGEHKVVDWYYAYDEITDYRVNVTSAEFQ